MHLEPHAFSSALFPSSSLGRASCALLLALVMTGVCAEPIPTRQQPPDKPQPRVIDYRWMNTDTWWQMHRDQLARAESGPVDLLFLGDSITEGWDGAGKAVWQKQFASRNAANFGIGGDTTQNLLWRITDGGVLGKLNPEAVVLMIGTNNFGLGQHKPDQVIAGVTAVVEALGEALPETPVLLLGIFPRNRESKSLIREKIRLANEGLAALDDGERVHYLDIGEVFLEDDGSLSKEVMPDYLHLSPEGYRRWAEAIAEPLEKLTKK